jgi:hypothetical protein
MYLNLTSLRLLLNLFSNNNLNFNRVLFNRIHLPLKHNKLITINRIHKNHLKNNKLRMNRICRSLLLHPILKILKLVLKTIIKANSNNNKLSQFQTNLRLKLSILILKTNSLLLKNPLSENIIKKKNNY